MKKLLIFGDSITYGKRDPECGRANRLRKIIDQKYNLDGKRQNIQTYNLGIPGDLVITLHKRFSTELQSRAMKPGEQITIIISIGTNDVNDNNRLTRKQTPSDDFIQAFEDIITTAKQYNSTIFLMGLTPINEKNYFPVHNTTQPDQYNNQLIAEYNALLKGIAQEQETQFIDILEACLQDQQFMQDLKDGIHPEAYGHQKLCDLVIKEILPE